MKRKVAFFSLFMMLTALSVSGQDGLVSYWSFDNIQSDTIFDYSGNANHGTNYGGEVVEGMKGNALEFDGETDYARIPENGEDPPDILEDLEYGSISIWFKVDNIPTDYGIAPAFYYGAEEMCDFFDAANQGMIIELGHSPIYMGSESIFFTIWKNGCTYPSFCFDSDSPVSEGEWHHFVAVVGENYNTGYLDGQEMVSRRYSFGNDTFSQFFADAVLHEKLWLGKGYWDETVQYFDGAIDELRIYEEPLTAEQVQSLYSDTTTTTSTNPLKEGSSDIKVYPNPASEKVNYDIANVEATVTAVKLTDMSGKVVINQPKAADKKHLDISHLPEGVYFMNFHHKEGIYRKKVVISD
ncbi:MAG: T9SS type A sorting domain-containing protein [Bacteroidales bacterium]|nr:T9SS type A sorting domain-containing protein [Bacteroidales bacterium]MCF8333792.1 T9SS type A sorting domain-containing protein [Bacteroidales bacterium]